MTTKQSFKKPQEKYIAIKTGSKEKLEIPPDLEFDIRFLNIFNLFFGLKRTLFSKMATDHEPRAMLEEFESNFMMNLKILSMKGFNKKQKITDRYCKLIDDVLLLNRYIKDNPLRIEQISKDLLHALDNNLKYLKSFWGASEDAEGGQGKEKAPGKRSKTFERKKAARSGSLKKKKVSGSGSKTKGRRSLVTPEVGKKGDKQPQNVIRGSKVTVSSRPAPTTKKQKLSLKSRKTAHGKAEQASRYNTRRSLDPGKSSLPPSKVSSTRILKGEQNPINPKIEFKNGLQKFPRYSFKKIDLATAKSRQSAVLGSQTAQNTQNGKSEEIGWRVSRGADLEERRPSERVSWNPGLISRKGSLVDKMNSGKSSKVREDRVGSQRPRERPQSGEKGADIEQDMFDTDREGKMEKFRESVVVVRELEGGGFKGVNRDNRGSLPPHFAVPVPGGAGLGDQRDGYKTCGYVRQKDDEMEFIGDQISDPLRVLSIISGDETVEENRLCPSDKFNEKLDVRNIQNSPISGDKKAILIINSNGRGVVCQREASRQHF